MTQDLTFRNKYRHILEELSNTISDYDQRFHETGDPNFALFRDHNIRHLQELKEYILKKEREIEEESAQGEFDFE